MITECQFLSCVMTVLRHSTFTADYLSHYLSFLNFCECLCHCLGGLSLFRDFLRSEYSDENLEFWIACEDYRTLKDDRLVAQAQKIFADFVAIQAPREVCGLPQSFLNKCTILPVLGWMQCYMM